MWLGQILFCLMSCLITDIIAPVSAKNLLGFFSTITPITNSLEVGRLSQPTSAICMADRLLSCLISSFVSGLTGQCWLLANLSLGALPIWIFYSCVHSAQTLACLVLYIWNSASAISIAILKWSCFVVFLLATIFGKTSWLSAIKANSEHMTATKVCCIVLWVIQPPWFLCLYLLYSNSNLYSFHKGRWHSISYLSPKDQNNLLV